MITSSPDKYNDVLKHIDRNIVILLSVILIIALYVITLKEKLELIKLNGQYKLISEFIENDKIFTKHLTRKKNLYIDFNRDVYLMNGKKKNDYNNAMATFSPIFSGRRGYWGWDNNLSDGMFNYKTLVGEVFLSDFDLWNTRGKERTNKMWGNQRPDEIDIKNKLDRYIKNQSYQMNFFMQNTTIKLQFIKDIMHRYNITVDTIQSLDSIKKPFGEQPEKQYEKEFIKFFNDSTQESGGATTFLGFIYMDKNMFYSVNDLYDRTVNIYYEKYIKDKFSIYDVNIFENPLPYSSYMNSIMKKQEDIRNKLKGNIDIQDNIKPPYLPVELNISFFINSVYWLYLIFSIFLVRYISYHRKIVERYKKNNNLLNPYPTILVIMFKNIWQKLMGPILYLLVFVCVLSTILLVSNKYWDILYNSLNYITWFYVPVLLTILFLSYNFVRDIYFGLKKSV